MPYVTCPARGLAESRGKCAKHKPSPFSAGKEPLHEALSSHRAGTRCSQSHVSRRDKHVVFPRTKPRREVLILNFFFNWDYLQRDLGEAIHTETNGT